jgi:hypothetical protein
VATALTVTINAATMNRYFFICLLVVGTAYPLRARLRMEEPSAQRALHGEPLARGHSPLARPRHAMPRSVQDDQALWAVIPSLFRFGSARPNLD